MRRARKRATPSPREAARIARLRSELDTINRELLALLEKRGRRVRRVMAIKKRYRLPRHDPRRERQMIESLLRRSSGVYTTAGLRRIFARLFEVSRTLGILRPRKPGQLQNRSNRSGAEAPARHRPLTAQDSLSVETRTWTSLSPDRPAQRSQKPGNSRPART